MSRFSVTARMAAGVALSALSAGAFAGEPLPPEIVVTGAGLAPPPGEAAYDVVTIERDRIANTASNRLEDALRDVAGLAQFRRSDSGSAHQTSQGITLRGIGGNASSRVLVLLDGVPQVDPFGGWIPFPAYLPERLASIRVTRGGGSGYQGPGALTGTIELASAGPDTLGKLNIAGFYGSRDSVDAVAVGSAHVGEGQVTIAGQYRRSDGFIPIIGDDRGRADRASPYEQASLSLRAVTPVSDTAELQANLSGFIDRRERGYAYSEGKSEGVDASVRLVGRGDWQWSALAYVQMRGFSSGFASINADRSVAAPTNDQYNVPSTGVGARVEFQPPLGEGKTLRFGADARHVEGRTQELYSFTSQPDPADRRPTRRRVAGGMSDTLGAFADFSLEAGAFTLSAGGRLDHWEIRSGSLSEAPLAGGAANVTNYADRSGEEATGRVGVAFAAAQGVSLRAAGYRGWRLPALNELYRPFRVGNDVTNANAALSPERLWGAEVGLDLTPVEGLSLRGTAFWNRLDDAIANVTIADNGDSVTRQRRNLDAVEAKGAEFDLAWQHGSFGLAASYAYTDSRIVATGAGAAPLDGLRPAQTAAHQASGTVSWRRDGLGGAVTARYVGPQFEDDQNQRTLREAFTVDAQLALPITDGLSVEARGENLFDARVEATVSAAGVVERATPRTLWVGFRYRLD